MIVHIPYYMNKDADGNFAGLATISQDIISCTQFNILERLAIDGDATTVEEVIDDVDSYGASFETDDRQYIESYDLSVMLSQLPPKIEIEDMGSNPSGIWVKVDLRK